MVKLLKKNLCKDSPIALNNHKQIVCYKTRKRIPLPTETHTQTKESNPFSVFRLKHSMGLYFL